MNFGKANCNIFCQAERYFSFVFRYSKKNLLLFPVVLGCQNNHSITLEYSSILHWCRDQDGIEIGLAVERKDKGPEQNLETEIEKVGPLQDLDIVPVSIPTGIDLDTLDVVNMTICKRMPKHLN